MTNATKSTESIKESEIKRNWHLIDVSGKILGRMAPEIAKLLQGKHKVNYVQYLDMGDNVIVVNAKKVVISGKKASTKIYTSFSGYPGGLRRMSYKKVMEENPAMIIERAVSGMLPKNKQRDRRMRRLFVYADAIHPHADKFKVTNL
ncbi:MAG: 50S ribosomal protein L13 [bacterium]|nr:50S ribosomal protein L13 [bacterium]